MHRVRHTKCSERLTSGSIRHIGKYRVERTTIRIALTGAPGGCKASSPAEAGGRTYQPLLTVHYSCEMEGLIDGGNALNSAENCWPLYAKLSGGNIVPCDFIVSATGVTPNTGVLDDGFKVRGQITPRGSRETTMECSLTVMYMRRDFRIMKLSVSHSNTPVSSPVCQ